MSSSGPRSRLDRLLAEVRAQRAPEPVEPGLPPRLRAEFRSLAEGSSGLRILVRPSAARRWWPALALAAAAAALALVLVRSGDRLPESGPRVIAPIAELDGQALEVGVLVVAAEQPRHVEHPGRARWQLAPGSEGRLLAAAGGVLRVSLERGSLSAEVEPSGQAASFVVQARGTEVAVHGTRFVVSVHEERVHVSVTRGQVQVRPVVLGRAVLPTTGMLLGPGMQADFWAGATEPPAPAPAAARAGTSVLRADPPPPIAPLAPAQGARPARPGTSPSTPAAAKPSASAASPAAGATAPSNAASTAPAPALAVVPTAAPSASVEQALETVTGHVQHCFREQLPGSNELGIEAVTRLGLWVEPDGELLRADFDPPLAPGVERCVAAQLSHLRVARSPAGFRVQREIRLRR